MNGTGNTVSGCEHLVRKRRNIRLQLIFKTAIVKSYLYTYTIC